MCHSIIPTYPNTALVQIWDPKGHVIPTIIPKILPLTSAGTPDLDPHGHLGHVPQCGALLGESSQNPPKKTWDLGFGGLEGFEVWRV